MDINSEIVDFAGRQVFNLGGPKAWKTAEFKGYSVSLEWFEGRRSCEPMLVIWPSVSGRDAGAWGICLSSAGKFAHDKGGHITGKPSAEAFTEASDVLAEMFDRVPLAAEIKTLVDVVMRFLPDLITMPPLPMAARAEGDAPVLDVTRQVDGKTVSEVSI